MGGRAGARGDSVGERISDGWLGGRAGGRSAATFLYTISGFSSKYVIISRADGLKWRGELKCFLIPGKFNHVGNIKV